MRRGTVGPVCDVWRSIKVEVAPLGNTPSHGRWTQRVIWPEKAGSIFCVPVSRRAELKVTYLHGEVNICEEGSPRCDVGCVGRAVFGAEAETRRCTRRAIGIRKAVCGARDHVAGSRRGKVVDIYFEGKPVVLDGNDDVIPRVHEQGVGIGRECGRSLGAGSSWAGRNAVLLNEGEIYWLKAKIVLCYAVDGQRRTPVCMIATELVDEWLPSGWIKLHFKQRRTRDRWTVGVAIGSTSTIRVGVRIAEGQTKPERGVILKVRRLRTILLGSGVRSRKG